MQTIKLAFQSAAILQTQISSIFSQPKKIKILPPERIMYYTNILPISKNPRKCSKNAKYKYTTDILSPNTID